MPTLTTRPRLFRIILPAMVGVAVAVGLSHAPSARAGSDADPMPLLFAQAPAQPTAGAPDTAAGAPADGRPAEATDGGARQDGARHAGMDGDGGWHGARHGMEHREAWAARRRLRLADRLATLHVYLDITPQQEDAWHGFTQAVLAMVPDPATMPPVQAAGAFDGIDRMAKMFQRRADAARTVDDAAQKLKGVLTPAQITKADAAWTALREHMHARWHVHRWHDEDDDGR